MVAAGDVLTLLILTVLAILKMTRAETESRGNLVISASVSNHLCTQYDTFVIMNSTQPATKSRPPHVHARCGGYKYVAKDNTFIGIGTECDSTGNGSTLLHDGRIVGGNVVFPENKWPWQVSLQTVSGGKEQHFCGGVVLSYRTILTAGHCMPGEPGAPTQFFVWLGIGNLQSKFGQKIQPQSYIKHPEYNLATHKADIALIFLERPASNGPDVKPIQINENPQKPAVNDRCYVTGWGSIDADVAKQPDELQEIVMNAMDNKKCKESFVNLKDEQICFTGGGDQSREGACTGDSGGPVSCLGGGTVFLAATTSYGGKCGVLPTVFIRTSPYMKWIKDNIKT